MLEPAKSDALPCSPSPLLELGEVATTCWGALLGDVECTPDFVPGKLHFKNKFCHSCREGILVPLAQVRAISAEQAAYFINRFSKGFWNNAPVSMGGGQYRIINNTAGCVAPLMALFSGQPPQLDWCAESKPKPRLSLIPNPQTHPTSKPSTPSPSSGRPCPSTGTLRTGTCVCASPRGRWYPQGSSSARPHRSA